MSKEKIGERRERKKILPSGSVLMMMPGELGPNPIELEAVMKNSYSM